MREPTLANVSSRTLVLSISFKAVVLPNTCLGFSCLGFPALRASDLLYQTIGHDMSGMSNILRLPTLSSTSQEFLKAVLPPRFLHQFYCPARGSDWLWYGQHTFSLRDTNALSLNEYVRGSSRFLYKTIASPTCLNISTYRASFVLSSHTVLDLRNTASRKTPLETSPKTSTRTSQPDKCKVLISQKQ